MWATEDSLSTHSHISFVQYLKLAFQLKDRTSTMLAFSMLTTFSIEWQILDRPQKQYYLQTNIIFFVRKKKVSLHWEASLLYREGLEKQKYLGVSPLDRETVKTKCPWLHAWTLVNRHSRLLICLRVSTVSSWASLTIVTFIKYFLHARKFPRQAVWKWQSWDRSQNLLSCHVTHHPSESVKCSSVFVIKTHWHQGRRRLDNWIFRRKIP